MRRVNIVEPDEPEWLVSAYTELTGVPAVKRKRRVSIAPVLKALPQQPEPRLVSMKSSMNVPSQRHVTITPRVPETTSAPSNGEDNWKMQPQRQVSIEKSDMQLHEPRKRPRQPLTQQPQRVVSIDSAASKRLRTSATAMPYTLASSRHGGDDGRSSLDTLISQHAKGFSTLLTRRLKSEADVVAQRAAVELTVQRLDETLGAAFKHVANGADGRRPWSHVRHRKVKRGRT
mgnify:CR=1 FL=1